MKTIKLLNCIVVSLIFSLFSCTDEFYDDSCVEEGLPASVTIKLNAEENNVVSRAALDESTENRVANLYLFIFDVNGNLHSKKFYGSSELSYDDGTKSGTVQIETTSLNDAQIVGIANVNTETEKYLYNISQSELDEVNSIDDLKNRVVYLNSETIERSGILLMTGEINNLNISPGSGTQPTLSLRRVDAKVKFVFTAEPSDPTWQSFTFRAKTWTIKNVPSQSMLLEKEIGDYDGGQENVEAKYFSSLTRDFEVRDEELEDGKKGNSFEFYMPENRKQPINSVEDYAQRDAWSGETEDGRTFTNANPNSTYADITGSLSYKQQDGTNVNADVRFIIHLGEDASDPNNYETKRNTHYTYKVTVCGVNAIIVEVGDDGKEVRPGYEGDVIFNKSQSFEFDSHYDRCLIHINPSNINSNNVMQWAVSTPFSRGTHKLLDDNGNVNVVEENLRDYRWIKFAVNREYGVRNDKLVKYPGDQNYNDPFPMNGAIKGIDFDASSPYYDGGEGGNFPHARLLDINQLCVYLNDHRTENEELAITVFVDEYLYFKHPIYGTEDEDSRSLWKLTADKGERSLHLIVEDAKLSQDDNSSSVIAEYSFKQRAIQTVYDPDNEDLDTAWGLESKMEGNRMQIQGQQGGSDMYNGRLNTVNYILNSNLKWTDVLGTGSSYELKQNSAIYACMMRNRDLNGDNIIQANEIRWYLAAIDQLVDIFIGEAALDEESRLYPRDASERENKTRWHYISSTNHNEGGSWILWAEEGASKNSSNNSVDDNGNKNTTFSYRCVRNLGISINNITEEPKRLAEWTKESDGSYTFDLSRMNPKARRLSAVRAELPPHNERDVLNRPYVKFRVSNIDYPEITGYSAKSYWEGWSQIYYLDWGPNAHDPDYFRTHRVSPVGWRMPNHRELLLISLLANEDGLWNDYTVKYGWRDQYSITKKPRYMCSTEFSLNGKSPYPDTRNGFFFNSDNGGVALYNGGASEPQKGFVRPVQDVE